MKIGLRKIIYKIPFAYALCVGIVDVNNRVFYRRFCKHSENLEKLKRLKNTKLGKRCFIVGNGPSLLISDLELIKGEDTFAANLIYKIFDKTEWRPTYYFIQDRYADTGNSLDGLEIPYMFIGDYYWRKRGINNKNAICFHTHKRNVSGQIGFSRDIECGVFDSYTITYSMIQVAAYLGYKEIYFLGMDHNYALSYDSSGNVKRDESVKSHFFEDKNPDDVIANIEGMNKAYIAARGYADNYGMKIINVTRGGRLDWFPRASLEEVLGIETVGNGDGIDSNIG